MLQRRGKWRGEEGMGRRGREEGREKEERGGEGEEGRGMRRREGLNKKKGGEDREKERRRERESYVWQSCDLCAPQDLSNDYYCGCVMGWEGKNCSVETNECVNRPCLNGATCNVS